MSLDVWGIYFETNNQPRPTDRRKFEDRRKEQRVRINELGRGNSPQERVMYASVKQPIGPLAAGQDVH